jgi:long-chain fatty acid transport protein
MKKVINGLTVTALVAGLITAGSAFATNGYFTHGIGTKNKAMAGSGIAMPEDAIDITNNPAVAAVVGDHLVFGAALFSPSRKYETSASQLNGQFGSFTIGPNKLTSDKDLFVIPHIARNWQLENGNSLGVAFYGRGGMNTTWKGGTATFDPDGPGPAPIMTLEGTYGGGKAGVNLSQAFLDLTYARALNDRFSIGAAAVLVAQMFKADGVGNFAGYTETFAASGGMTMPQNLSNNGTDWSYGAGFKLGFHSQLTEQFSMGLMYQSTIWMSDLDDYSDLFAQHGGFDIPANLKFGVTFRATDAIALNFDIDHIWYSDVDSVGNSIANIFACPTAGQGGTSLSSCLGGENGAGFGWDDMTVYKAGLKWKAGEDWTWRFGYSYGKQPIPNSEMTFNILAPGVMESHLTTGFTLSRTPNREWNVSLMYAPNKKVTGPQNFDPTQNVTFEMHQFELEVSYGMRF